MRIRLIALGILSVLAMTRCGKSNSGTATGSMTMKMKAVNYGAARALAATNTNNGISSVDSLAFSILSGPPQAMTVYLQSISGTSTGADSTVFWTSTASNTTASGFTVTGCPLTLTSGAIDLSGCPGLSTMAPAVGTYTGIKLTFAEPADIKGCLRAKFTNVATATPTAGTHTYPSQFPSTVFNYTTEGVTNGTTYTYCTRSDKSYFNAETASTTAIGTNASYAPGDAYFATKTEPDFVTIDISSGNGTAKTMAQLKAASVDVNVKSAFTIAAGGTAPTVTMVVDMNRMLEFFANTRSDFNPPNPAMHTGTSYFYTNRFQATGGATAVSAVNAFAGDIGTIEGYQMIVTGQGVAGWFTLYRDAAGNYIGGILYEDDDNGLTIMKGNASLTSGTLAAGATITIDAGTLTNFTSLPTVGAVGAATLTWARGTAPVAYQRLL